MFRMNDQTLPIPNPSDWATMRAAAEVLGVDYQTVHRWRSEGLLTAHRTLGGAPICWMPEVLDLKAARDRLARS
jgi:predicted site-specific integrase-resolvase